MAVAAKLVSCRLLLCGDQHCPERVYRFSGFQPVAPVQSWSRAQANQNIFRQTPRPDVAAAGTPGHCRST